MLDQSHAQLSKAAKKPVGDPKNGRITSDGGSLNMPNQLAEWIDHRAAPWFQELVGVLKLVGDAENLLTGRHYGNENVTEAIGKFDRYTSVRHCLCLVCSTVFVAKTLPFLADVQAGSIEYWPHPEQGIVVKRPAISDESCKSVPFSRFLPTHGGSRVCVSGGVPGSEGRRESHHHRAGAPGVLAVQALRRRLVTHCPSLPFTALALPFHCPFSAVLLASQVSVPDRDRVPQLVRRRRIRGHSGKAHCLCLVFPLPPPVQGWEVEAALAQLRAVAAVGLHSVADSAVQQEILCLGAAVGAGPPKDSGTARTGGLLLF